MGIRAAKSRWINILPPKSAEVWLLFSYFLIWFNLCPRAISFMGTYYNIKYKWGTTLVYKKAFCITVTSTAALWNRINWIRRCHIFSRLDLLASWGRTETALRREAYRRATAPSPLSTRRASMETQRETHWDTHTRAHKGRAKWVSRLDIPQQQSRPPKHMTGWKLDHGLISHLPRVIPHLLRNILWQLQGLYCWERFTCAMGTPGSCSNPHHGRKDV